MSQIGIGATVHAREHITALVASQTARFVS
jgi:hypothetical protein